MNFIALLRDKIICDAPRRHHAAVASLRGGGSLIGMFRTLELTRKRFKASFKTFI